MVTLIALALALSAGQVEETILQRFEPSAVTRLAPAGHPAVAYEWRIEGVERPYELEAVGERILSALGTTTSAPWEREPKDLLERYTPKNPVIQFMMGAKDNVGYSWDRAKLEGRIVVFDPARIPGPREPVAPIVAEASDPPRLASATFPP
jgi:hypothetical protein